jgi:hypothetical protein
VRDEPAVAEDLLVQVVKPLAYRSTTDYRTA